jgi:hypothetical protein
MDRLLFPGFSMIEAGQLYARRFEERSRNLALDFAQSSLDRLEVMGLAQRRPHLADRRARSLAITEEAREVLPLLRNIVGESLREALTGLSTKETAILAKALHRVIANLSALDRLMTSQLVTFRGAAGRSSQKRATMRA